MMHEVCLRPNAADSGPRLRGRSARFALYEKYAAKLAYNANLNRALVSFQANKRVPFYRWMKYKEAFSSELVLYLLNRFRPPRVEEPSVLDPFAGVGTTLTMAAKEGWRATGIELLPVGVAAIRARLLADTVSIRSFQNQLCRLERFPLDTNKTERFPFRHLRITEKAFPPETERALSSYSHFLRGIPNGTVRFLYWFAALTILEDVSYTRKDGQYLRWDYRSGRNLKSAFHKGIIQEFKPAILHKLRVMLDDIRERDGGCVARRAQVMEGSCLIELLNLPASAFHLVLTSPPYCNRYDYTRTYALELAFLGKDETALKSLRQSLLSCTVENRSKAAMLEKEYESRHLLSCYKAAIRSFDKAEALHEVLGLLRQAGVAGKLNNNNIPQMVENYFFEMNLVIHELARVISPGGSVVMVNDNVQYHGEEVPVDLILSEFASNAGLSIDAIWILPRGKGNSSQQMGAFGRNEIRKCVYVWSRPPS
jgi:DNA modification methylase